jgi:NHLM bacteriocin system ABC transporter ATP-binding protein
MSIFSSQIDKRRKYDSSSLSHEIIEGAARMGLHYSDPIPQTDHLSVRQVLRALQIFDYELENDDIVPLEQQFSNILHTHGIMKRMVQLNDGWWKETSGPLLGRTQSGHLVALLPKWTGRSYYYINAEGIRQKVTRQRMEYDLEPEAYAFTKSLPLHRLTKREVVAFILASANNHSLIYMCLAALVVVLLGMIVPMANKFVFDTVIPAGNPAALAPIAGLMTGAAVAVLLFSFIRNLYILRVENILEMNLHNAVMARLFLLPARFFHSHSSGELTSKMNNLTQLCQQVNESVVGALLGGALSIVYFIQVGIYGGRLLAPAAVLYVLQALMVVLYFRTVVRLNQQFISKNDTLNGMECNLFAGIQKIKLTGSETRAYTQWLNRYTNTTHIIYNPRFLLRLFPSLLALMSVVNLLVIYFFTRRFSIETSNFIAFTSAFGMLTAALSEIIRQIPEMAKIGPQLDSIMAIAETETEISGPSAAISSLSGSIKISHLSFRYQEDMPLVIDDLSLNIKDGEYVGIAGASGCGKSTLLRLLLGFETPLRGNISYDHYDLAKADKSELRRRIGSCLQNGRLFTGDIFHNITITAPWATHDDAWEALRMACMYDEVKALPMGLHTVITEDGGGFSGGQKQRLLIARALIGRPSILFFDEATSALDNISQKQVSDNLDRLHCTRLVIAHRLSTIRHCDRIIVLDKGKIAEEGTFEELMARKGLFYEMSLRQL